MFSRTGFVTFKSVETATKVLGLPEEDLTLRYRYDWYNLKLVH